MIMSIQISFQNLDVNSKSLTRSRIIVLQRKSPENKWHAFTGKEEFGRKV